MCYKSAAKRGNGQERAFAARNPRRETTASPPARIHGRGRFDALRIRLEDPLSRCQQEGKPDERDYRIGALRISAPENPKFPHSQAQTKVPFFRVSRFEQQTQREEAI